MKHIKDPNETRKMSQSSEPINKKDDIINKERNKKFLTGMLVFVVLSGVALFLLLTEGGNEKAEISRKLVIMIPVWIAIFIPTIIANKKFLKKDQKVTPLDMYKRTIPAVIGLLLFGVVMIFYLKLYLK